MTRSDAITAALAQKDGQPSAALHALGLLAEKITGAKLVTLMTSDSTTKEAQRIWSNMPDDYPVMGTKPMNETYWSRIVLEEHNTFVANDIGTIAEVFTDHQQIAALGCASVINLPIIVGGTVLGTINCLDVAGYFTPDRVAEADSLRLPAAAVFLLDRLQKTKGAL